ncbi:MULTISPECIES: hypothetical protein [unclassified Roseateles]|uniref:hypothetical protein n=1 Tax=Pelomonas sp. Root1237 TaxID=1736434 RepID=UPI0006F7D521|nr:hypothetical protein [Pelomonas sp. Root1237]KQV88353.1 hypothetical protein ASC91_16240 [Pelomonas sp. Root1237]
MKASAIVAAIGVGVLATALAKPTGLPSGWLQTGSAKTCEGSVVPANGAPSAKVFNIECKPDTEGFSTLMQQIGSADYAGKRVRLTAQVHGDQIAAWAGLWMRADSGQRPGTAFDNMNDRPLRGSFGWQTAQVVLDIPADATTLSFGFLLEGTGQLQATQFQLDVVPASTPTTGQGPIQVLPRQAGNLTPP